MNIKITVGLLIATGLAAAAQVKAQQAGRVYRLGILSPAAVPSASFPASVNLVPMALRELGYVEGQNLVIERRFAEGKVDRLPRLAQELAQLRVDVIVAVSVPAIQAAKNATKTIPIVMGFGGDDPVASRLVESLARPGGNITGVSLAAGSALAGKRVELIKEAVPRAARIAILATGDPGSKTQVQEAQTAASALGLKLVVVEIQDDDYDRAFATMVAERAGGVFVLSSPILNRDRKRIIELAAKQRLPAIYEWREHVDEGGLMAYGTSVLGLSRRVAAYVDRIFKGANPADLPVEQPTKFEFVINLKTAKQIGLTIPPNVLARADRVIL